MHTKGCNLFSPVLLLATLSSHPGRQPHLWGMIDSPVQLAGADVGPM